MGFKIVKKKQQPQARHLKRDFTSGTPSIMGLHLPETQIVNGGVTLQTLESN
jgi:hypothetical protein